ncbi:MAG: hypothetical protein OXI96_10790 [Acidimicrobiaceae bacterium]|nr:hypothetical protein [Acidimicrobiaceae bacterium]
MIKRNSRSLGSSKKIQKAARIAAKSGDSHQRKELGFSAIIVVVVILGIVMVLISKGLQTPVTPPRITDHWHSAYGVYDCDRWLDPFTSDYDPDGIHSHRDGVIHIHPWNSSATGDDASLGVFFESMGVTVTVDEISSEFGVLKAGSDCDGQPTVIRAARFALGDPSTDLQEIINASDDAERAQILESKYQEFEQYSTDFHQIRILEDLEVFTIARVSVDATIPLPPRARLLESFNASGGRVLSSGPVPVIPDDLPPNDGSDVSAEDTEDELPPGGDTSSEEPTDITDLPEPTGTAGFGTADSSADN